MSLNVESIDVSYGGLQVLFRVSLAVQSGEMVCVLGGNAAGKSTVLKAILGLVSLTSGLVTLEGNRIDGRGAEANVQAGLAMVPENRRLFPDMTVAKNLRLGAWHQPDAGRSERLQQVSELLPFVASVLDRKAGTLSGGEQQQVAVARALMSNPQYLLMDEPSMGLAPALVERSFALLDDLRALGLGLLVVEQNTFQALAMADRAYVLREGRIVLEGRAEDLQESAAVREAFLGLPAV